MIVELRSGATECGTREIGVQDGLSGWRCKEWEMRPWIALTTAAFAACTAQADLARRNSVEVNGSSLLVDLSPANRPQLVGALDFDLLGMGSASACATRDSGVSYWVGISSLERISPDSLTRQAIAAAVMDAVQRLDEDVDTILLTSVVTQAKGADKVCATVVGRGVRLVKAGHNGSAGSAMSPDASGSANDTFRQRE